MNNDGVSKLSSKLSDEQLRDFVMQLAPEDRSVLMERLASCSKEKLFTRCIPLAALVTGGMYFARNFLKKIIKRRIGAPLYIFAAVSTVAVTNYNALRGECKSRSFSVLDDLIKKYNYNPNVGTASGNSRLQKHQNIVDIKTPQNAGETSEYQLYNNTESKSVSYSDLRKRNRLNVESVTQRRSSYSDHPESMMKMPPEPRPVKAWVDTDAVLEDVAQNDYSHRKDYAVQAPNSVDDAPLMSGTPVGEPTTSFGDEGFS